MPTLEARPARTADLPGMAEALADAFHDDPVMAYVFGSESSFSQRNLRAFFRHEGARHLRNQHVFTDDQHGGAAYWDPPGRWKTGFRDYLRVAAPMLLGINRRIPRALRGLAQVEAVHDRQPQDHYYLAVLGTRTAKQGTGVGSAMLAPVLEVCDRDGVGAYLESSKEANIPFYRRHGFEVVEEIEFGRGGPTLWAMWRDPQPPEPTSG
jgi:ribosomal protein S18 acetylase RimI-like enzyme